ncbi:hypothetical protein [Solimonas marina]|uniref:BIG2 domain-containing protein n=1 Tax=Solimonas marina TaxID=2714601 RepID=A0A970B602_9GAMM|nr:hypothetical protein [Solimonas marina]NKF23932.1 hypothetical protein [Solimonas marina]
MAGCNGGSPVGTGKGPQSLEVTYDSSPDAVDMVECQTSTLSATATFADDDGNHASTTDVSARVVWSSSNPGVIDVSNGDIETYAGSGSYYATGTVIARSTGSAVITATYADTMTASIGVNAAEISSMRISPVLTRMAPDSQTTFSLYVQPQLDQLEQDLTSSAVWSITDAGAPAVVSGVSLVTASRTPVDQDFTLEARLPACNKYLTQVMSIGNVSSLKLTYEQPEDQPVPVVLGDRVKVEAVFDDTSAPNQNLSGQVDVEAADGYNESNATTSVSSAATTTDSNGTTQLQLTPYLLVNGDEDRLNREIALKLTYDEDGIDMSTTTRVYTFTDTDMLSLRIDPTETNLQFPNLGQLQAYGTFEDGVERPVTRLVNWVLYDTGDSDLLTVTSSGINGGLMTPYDVGGDARVFATYDSDPAGELEEHATVHVLQQTDY